MSPPIFRRMAQPRLRREPQRSSALKHRLLLIAILLLGAWLRFDALTHDIRFHPDEALFATFARDAAVHGRWMFPGALDKPPLTLYAAALSMHGAGVFINSKGVLDLDLRTGEFAARLPSVWAGVVSIALTYTLTYTLTCMLTRRSDAARSAALIAALLMALSPFHVAFSATAFTDPLMLACGLTSLVMAARGHPVWAGLWLALSVWSKQQGIFLLPLALWLVALSSGRLGAFGGRYFIQRPSKKVCHPFFTPPVTLRVPPSPFHFVHGESLKTAWPVPSPPAGRAREGSKKQIPTPERRLGGGLQQWRSGAGLLMTFLLGVGLLFIWDAARASTLDATSLFTLAAANNNPERTFIRPDELLPRLRVWTEYLSSFFGPPLLTAALMAAGVIGVLCRWRRWPTLTALIVYTLLYLLAHWLIAFNLYDRYLLPLVPLLAVIIGAGLAQWMPVLNRVWGKLQVIVIAVLAAVMLISAYPPRYPTDDRPRDAAIIDLATHLNGKPLGAILYDPWLGWELGYYLGPWSDKRRVHYPAPDVLAADALLNPDTAPRYFIAPRERDITAWLAALEAAAFEIAPDWNGPRYVVFELIPPRIVVSR